MSIRKIVLLNKDNVVLTAMTFDDSNLIEQGVVAGFLSDPEFVEVEYTSQAGIGWKYINGEAIRG